MDIMNTDRIKNIKKDVIYRCIGDDFNSGVLACGYMPKPTAQSSQHHFVIGYYSAVIVLSGSGTYSDSRHKNMSLGPGSFVQRIPGNVHTTAICPDGQWLEFFISFGKPVYDYMDQLHLLPKTPVIQSAFDITAPAPLDRLLKRLKHALPDQFPGILIDMQQTLLLLSRQAAPSAGPPSVPDAIKEACHILSADFSKNIPLPALARQLNLSYESFRKQFRKYTGTSPDSYRKDQRIRQAALLLNSGIPIKETALMTGYADTYAFTRAFTKAMGCPPGKYRRSERPAEQTGNRQI